MSIIERIVQIMDLKHLNQTELCRILQITNSTFSTWKTRGTDPPAKYLILICDFLGVSVDYLLGRTNELNTSNTSKQLTQNEQELLDIFKKFSERDQIKILGKMEDWTSKVPVAPSSTSQPEKVQKAPDRPWRMAARSSDGSYTTRTLSPEEVEIIKSLEDGPEDF